MTRITRRNLMGSAAGAVAATGMGLGASREASAEERLRVFWWGNPERNKRTFAVVDLYKTVRPGVTVDAETIGWDDYWPKMATQASGKNMADVVQMDYRYLFEYARRGQLEALDPYIGKGLDLTHFNKTFLDSGKVDGKLYAVPWTSNSVMCIYDTEKLASLGIAAPTNAWTWDDLAKVGREIKKGAGGKDYWAIADKGHWEPMMELFMRQRGKALYGEDGKIAYTEADVADFYGLWDSFRQEGLLSSADLVAQDNSLQKMPLTLGNAAIDFAHSNQLVGLQTLNKPKLAIVMMPNTPGGKPGQYLKPSMLVSIAKTSQVKEEAVALTAFLVSSIEAGKVLRLERGVPGDSQVNDALLPDADPMEKATIDYLNAVSENVGPLPPPPPKGAGEVDSMGRRLYQQIAFGKLTPKEGATQFYKDATAILRRA